MAHTEDKLSSLLSLVPQLSVTAALKGLVLDDLPPSSPKFAGGEQHAKHE
jgi:hypothetical protein